MNFDYILIYRKCLKRFRTDNYRGFAVALHFTVCEFVVKKNCKKKKKFKNNLELLKWNYHLTNFFFLRDGVVPVQETTLNF